MFLKTIVGQAITDNSNGWWLRHCLLPMAAAPQKWQSINHSMTSIKKNSIQLRSFALEANVWATAWSHLWSRCRAALSVGRRMLRDGIP